MKKSVDDGIPMRTFKCEGCGNKFFDTNFYFYNKKSNKCLWCSKFPKPKLKIKNEQST